jgi:hypothetical protein
MGTLQTSAGLNASYHDRSTLPGWTWTRLTATFSSGTATATSDHPDLTLTHSTTGVYTGTFPPCASADLDFEILSASDTVITVHTAAKDASAGTFTIHCLSVTALADPGNSDILRITFRLRHHE